MSTGSNRRFIAADPAKCVGCCVCEYACSLIKEETFNPMKSRIRVVRLNSVLNISLTCRLCDDAPCVKACPRDALSQSEDTGIVKVDESKCNGCGWCAIACEHGAVMAHPKGEAVYVCDLCDGDTLCVEWCPEEALILTTTDELIDKTRETVTGRLFREALANASDT